MADVTLTYDGPVGIITMTRPEHHNAVDGPMAAELAAAMRKFEASDAAVGVLRGQGPSFCARANLKGGRHRPVQSQFARGRWADGYLADAADGKGRHGDFSDI